MRYDCAFEEPRIGDENRNPTKCVNAVGQTISSWGAGLAPVGSGYDPNTGQLTSMKTFTGNVSADASGVLSGDGTAETKWAYDPLTGFLSKKMYAGQTESTAGMKWNYNGKLQLDNVVEKGSKATYSYTAGGDLSGIAYSYSGSGTTPWDLPVYTISASGGRDAKGRVTNWNYTSQGSTLAYQRQYTAKDQLDFETQPTLGANYKTAYGYYTADASGNVPSGGSADALSSVSLKNGSMTLAAASYEYESGTGRLKRIRFGNQSFTYTYKDQTNLIETITSSQRESNGTNTTLAVTTYGYESGTGRLQSVITSQGGQMLYSVTYEYNDLDQREQAVIVRAQPGGATDAYAYTFDYDQYDQLSFFQKSGQNATVYSFNAIGNHTETGWVYNSLNQVTAAPGVSGTIGYDDRGNVTYAYPWTYRYDAQDRLIEAYTYNTTKVAFGYDADGRRTWKKTYAWQYSNWMWQWVLTEDRRFAYDGWNVIGEFVVQADGTNKLDKSYVWGQDLGGGIGGLLEIRTADGGTYFPFYDGNGNVMGLTDGTGEVKASYEYDPFGKILSATGEKADVSPFRFSTKYYDGETGLSWFGYRYYSATLQRWMSRDPIQESGDVNVYRFCGDDPVNHTDPMGTDYQWDNYQRILVMEDELRGIDEDLAKITETSARIYVERLRKQRNLTQWVITSRYALAKQWAAKDYDYNRGRLYQWSLSDGAETLWWRVHYAERGLSEHLAEGAPRVLSAPTKEEIAFDKLPAGTQKLVVGQNQRMADWGGSKFLATLDMMFVDRGDGAPMLIDALAALSGAAGGGTPAKQRLVVMEEIRPGYSVPVESLRGLGFGDYALRPPNRDGNVGGPLHQAKVADVVKDINARGLIARERVPFNTINGIKELRIMDVVAIDPKTGMIVEVHQIGQGLKLDPLVPKSRERDAFRDVRQSLELRGAKRVFHNYDE